MHVLRRQFPHAIASALLALFVTVPPAAAQTSPVFSVPGTANPYLAGMPIGSSCCAGLDENQNPTAPDIVPAQSPTQVTGVPLSAGTALTFNVSGSVSHLAGVPPVDPPDGSVFFDVGGVPGTPSRNEIAGVNAPVNALVGLFLNDAQPNSSGAPPGLNFDGNGLGTNFATLSPALKQVFFIGDGRTGAGAVQQFLVPAGATRLFLGTVDGLGWSNNSGAFSVQVTAAAFSPLVAAVLPSSRSVQVAAAATAFATIINTAAVPLDGCGISPATQVPASFVYQTTSSATNALTGAPNTPVTIPPGGAQSYVIAFTPTSPFGSTDVAFNFQCAGANPATTMSGLNTLLLTASAGPAADVIALAATENNTGIVNITNGVGAFAVATQNVGAPSTITASVSSPLPLSLSICQTNAAGGCIGAAGPSVTLGVGTNATPTFAIFAGAGGPIGFDPAVNRIFVRFTDGGGVIRGATSVAVRTQ